jgi:dCMP deaminase
MSRIDKDNYYLDVAETVSERSTCLRRHYGSVIVKNDEIIATGYNGSPRGEINCCDIGKCQRDVLGVAHGERYEECKSVHSEQNAIISPRRQDMIGSTLYLVGIEISGEYVTDTRPCKICTMFIKNAEISKVIVRKSKEDFKEINL